MLKKTVTAKDVCDILNELLSLDRACATNLVSHRVKCNKDVANHPTLQVSQYKKDKFPKIGIIGVINGIFGIREDGMGAICYEIENNRIDKTGKKITGKILKFKPTPKKAQK